MPFRARALVLLLPALIFSTSAAAEGGGNSASTITASFGDSCRDFQAHSSKDISHVEIHYADGRVVKDESTTTPDYSIDGGLGDEIDFALVKSGTTTEQFECDSDSPPIAILEIQTPPNCIFVEPIDHWFCRGDLPRTTWLDPRAIEFGCDSASDPLCDFTVLFRGTSSTDSDNDITSWTLNIDGTVTSGNWATNPPTAVAYTFAANNGAHVISLTVTDSAGQSSSDTILFAFDFPD